MPERITIAVLPDGQTRVDYQHFEGAACLQAGKELHARLHQLGIHVQRTAFMPKPELGLLTALDQATASEQAATIDQTTMLEKREEHNDERGTLS